MRIFAETKTIAMHRKNTIIRAIAAFAASLISICALHAQAGFGSSKKFNDGWKFFLEPSSNPYLANEPASATGEATGPGAGFAAPDFDDSSWRELDLPHDWSVEGLMSPSLASCLDWRAVPIRI